MSAPIEQGSLPYSVRTCSMRVIKAADVCAGESCHVTKHPQRAMLAALPTCCHPLLLPSTDAAHQLAANERVSTDLRMHSMIINPSWKQISSCTAHYPTAAKDRACPATVSMPMTSL